MNKNKNEKFSTKFIDYLSFDLRILLEKKFSIDNIQSKDILKSYFYFGRLQTTRQILT